MTRYTMLFVFASCLVAIAVSVPFEQKTAFELKERHDFYNPKNDNPFSTSGSEAHMKTQSARIEHDFIGGKNWAAGGYAQHDRQSMFGQTRRNNEGGFQFKARF